MSERKEVYELHSETKAGAAQGEERAAVSRGSIDPPDTKTPTFTEETAKAIGEERVSNLWDGLTVARCLGLASFGDLEAMIADGIIPDMRDRSARGRICWLAAEVLRVRDDSHREVCHDIRAITFKRANSHFQINGPGEPRVSLAKIEIRVSGKVRQGELRAVLRMRGIQDPGPLRWPPQPLNVWTTPARLEARLAWQFRKKASDARQLLKRVAALEAELAKAKRDR